MRIHLPLLLAVALLVPFTSARAASTLDKTPGTDSPTPTPPGQLDFFFSHAFAIDGPKLIASPTFLLEAGLLPRLAVGVSYSSSSDINGEVNELFPALRFEGLSQRGGAPLDLSAIAGYDTAGKSVDGALVFARDLGPVRAMVEARGFSDGYGVGGATFAGAVGLRIAITPSLALVGDVGKVLAAKNLAAIQAFNDKLTWSGGIAFKIPYSPHSVSLYVTNLNTRTLEGESRGGLEGWRFGFEFDVPFRDLGRYSAIFASHPAARVAQRSQAQSEAAAVAQGPQVTVRIRDYVYAPDPLVIDKGTTVTWVNEDDVAHSATADDGSWDSELIDPGARWSKTFTTPGRSPYYCTVHPNMKGTLVVK